MATHGAFPGQNAKRSEEASAWFNGAGKRPSFSHQVNRGIQHQHRGTTSSSQYGLCSTICSAIQRRGGVAALKPSPPNLIDSRSVCSTPRTPCGAKAIRCMRARTWRPREIRYATVRPDYVTLCPMVSLVPAPCCASLLSLLDFPPSFARRTCLGTMTPPFVPHLCHYALLRLLLRFGGQCAVSESGLFINPECCKPASNRESLATSMLRI